MDITMEYALSKIMVNPNPKYYKTQRYIRMVQNEIYAYRSTAYLNRGKNLASICNHSAMILQKQLERALKGK